MELEWEIMSHPSYSSDLSPTEFHLFPSLDNYTRNRQFDNEIDLEKEASRFPRDRTKDIYKNGIYELLERNL